MYRKLLPWHVEQNDKLISIKEIENNRFSKKDITILNWNVHKNNHSDEWLNDFNKILNKHKPDFITFQEYKKISKKSILNKNKKYGYGFCPNIALYEKDFGLINASTCNILSYNYLFSKHVEPLIKTPKISFFTQYQLDTKGILTIINTHMINFVKNDKYIDQIQQLKLLCSNHDTIILTGDFNTWSKKRINLLRQMTKKLGLKEVKFDNNLHRHPYLIHPLDYVFYKGLKLETKEVLYDIKTSDHKPLLVKFSLSSQTV